MVQPVYIWYKSLESGYIAPNFIMVECPDSSDASLDVKDASPETINNIQAHCLAL